ncbi:MAG: hypothetical protein KAV87_11845 [Desulfobacteraceae bacterium]|nr:hypothetical protein [Desulfobacteraceae bacterium]
MRLDCIKEPKLEFHACQHEDIRFGLMNYGPFDLGSPRAPDTIRLGMVGTDKTIDGAMRWIQKCCSGVAAKPSPLTNLFVRFPGFNKDSCFHSEIVFEHRCLRSIPTREIEKAVKTEEQTIAVQNSVTLFLEDIRFLSEEANVDAIVCAIPEQILDLRDVSEEIDATEEEDVQDSARVSFNFHDMLKASAMQFRKPIQLILPATYGEKMKGKKTNQFAKRRSLQDEATRAWNFFTALYYKAGGTPWRLPRPASELTTCYIGVNFYRTLDEKAVNTSIAEVFNELGDGIVIRGAQAQVNKEDRQPHLSAEDSKKILQDGLDLYREEHKTSPARVVLHKSSMFSESEKQGFFEVLKNNHIAVFDLISIRRSDTRLYRTRTYPPLRGMLFSLDEINHVLYTRGSVYFYETYPGMYIPHPILFKSAVSDQTPINIAREILALTKMNWNSSQFDHSMPITIDAADRVGDILKYVEADRAICPRYSYYM